MQVPDNLLFATLDTSSKRIRFPKERDVIVTDTVGFIRDLPANLAGAFKSTLEELHNADMFLHVVDISDKHFKKHIKSVEKVLEEMDLQEKERIIVFNKIDKLIDEKLDYNISFFWKPYSFAGSVKSCKKQIICINI